MKYIKIFENFEYEYYTEISDSEFDKLINIDRKDLINTDGERWVDFNSDDLKKILSYFPNCDYDMEKWKGYNKELLCIFPPLSSTKDDLYISIYKISDEWWCVDENQDEFINGRVIDHHKFYRCDQFEGLIKLLDDKKYFKDI